MVKDNLAKVRERILKVAAKQGRDPNTIKLVVVTKDAEVDRILEVVEDSVTDIGENRVKDAFLKKELMDSHVLTWHMIGHLQSNKAKDAVRIFSVIHSVDSVKLAYILNKEAKKLNKIQEILIEVNVSGEESKFGVKPDNLKSFLKETEHLKYIKILGLMTLAPWTENPELARPCFKALKRLADKHKLKELSMGMTQDFEVAIEEGSTMVRIGSAIFK